MNVITQISGSQSCFVAFLEAGVDGSGGQAAYLVLLIKTTVIMAVWRCHEKFNFANVGKSAFSPISYIF